MPSNLNIRLYQEADKPALLHLLQLNTPRYFAAEEMAEFVHYLDHEIEKYFVVEYEEQIVGCGGINFLEGGKVSRISWDVLHPDYQGKGIGSQLLKHRIDFLKTLNNTPKIIVRTSQLAFPFYQKGGFELKKIKKDYWAPGFDLYLMEYGEKK